MTRDYALRSLYWKETRQVLPLVWMQLGLCVAAHLLVSLWETDASLRARAVLVVGMPSLFALGVGALVVGQEKERRTFDWVRTLPIAYGDLLRAKLTVGLVALVVIWCLNLLMSGTFAVLWWPDRPRAWANAWFFDVGWEYLFPLQSVYLLLAGFLTAWLLRSSLLAVLAVIPLALMPAAISGLVWLSLVSWREGRDIGPLPLACVWAVSYVGLSLLLLVLGWRQGLRFLSAEEYRMRSRSWLTLFGRRSSCTSFATRIAYSPMTMLTWQFLRQNRIALISITVLLLLAFLLRGDPISIHSGRTFLAALLTLLAASWLGVLAFQGDLLHERIRFLAERGVSPTKVWCSRHVVGVSILSTVLLVFAFLVSSLSTTHSYATTASGPISKDCSTPQLLLYTVFLVLFSYAISQVVGQCLRSMIIAALTAPVLVGLLIGCWGLMVVWLVTPAWILLPAVLFPWLATWAMMRRWMDRRLGWGFWGVHAGLLVTAMVLPATPFLLAVVTQPGMPADVREQLTAEAAGYLPNFSEPPELTLPPESELPAPSRHRLSAWRPFREQIRQALSTHYGAFSIRSDLIAYLQGEARLARMKIVQDDQPRVARDCYSESLDLLRVIASRLRMSWRLCEQDQADLLEIWLIKELMNPQVRVWLGDDEYARRTRDLADAARRYAARRRAVVLSWSAYRNGFRRDDPNQTLGGHYWFFGVMWPRAPLSPFRRLRAADYLTWRMLQRLEDPAVANDPERIRELADYWLAPPLYYGLGLGGEYYRADRVSDFMLPGSTLNPSAPGAQWHADWERAARELAESL